MARVVQQRGGPPYLLIVFVFLFLLSTAMAVLFYTRYDKAAADVVREARARESLASPVELRRPEIVKILDAAQKPGAQQTVTGQLLGDIGGLMTAITGSANSTPNQVASEVDGLYAILSQHYGQNVVRAGGLVGTSKGLLAELQEAAQRAAKQEGELKAKDEELKAADGKLAEATAKSAKDIDQLKAQIRQFDDHRKTDQQAYATTLKAQAQQSEEAIAALNAKITENVGTVENLQKELIKQEKRALELEEEIKRLKGTSAQGAISPDGEVMRVLAESGICYINLGSKDHIQPGLAFAVYPKTGVTADGGKASIVVTDVEDNIAKCRIVRQKKDNPIAAGDLISNVAFSRTRTYKFFVEGQFDIQGTGRPNDDGTRVVKMLIARYGGKVVDKLDPVATDFVVMGAEPLKPEEPKEGANMIDWEHHQARLKAYQQYQDIRDQAQKLQIRILNINEFLDLTGYAPEQTLK